MALIVKRQQRNQIKGNNSQNTLENIQYRNYIAALSLNTMAWQRHSGNEQSRTIYFFHSFILLVVHIKQSSCRFSNKAQTARQFYNLESNLVAEHSNERLE